MQDVRNDRGGYDRIIAAAVAALVAMAATNASAQSNPATTPTELAIDAAVPMPEPANTPPLSPADFNTLARGLATGKPAKVETKPEAAPATTATAPAKDDPKQDDATRDDVAEKPPAPSAPAAVAPAAEPAKDTATAPASSTKPVAAPAMTATAKDSDPKQDDATRDDVAKKPPAPPAPATVAPAAEPAEDTATAPAASTIAAADQPIAEKIKDLLTARASRVFDRKEDRVAAETFYKERDYAPLWVADGVASARAKAAVTRLKAADADGLTASDYPVPDFAGASTPDALADADLRLTASVLDYARHAQGGRMHYTRVSADISYPEHNPEPADVLSNMATTQDAAAALDSYNPPHEGYKALKAKLAEERAGGVREETIIRIPDGPMLRPDMEDTRVPILRKRLKVTSDVDGLRYDEDVVDAVKTFQREAGLSPDGLVGPSTLRHLNGDTARAHTNVVDTILANMERWRWLPREIGEPKLGNAYVMLNIPDYTLKVMHNGAQAWATRVVVGKPGRQATPELTETMKFITVNPTWNVPPSIVYGEYLPALQQDPTVLERMGLRLTQRSDGSVHISQPPGAGNALGRIRFNFPNRFLVYQHDTPDKHLFARETRAYSHGCMRVQNPENYAETLLGIALPNENYTAAKIRSMYGRSEIDIRFPTPIPVHIVYHTAFVDNAGDLQIRKDVYGRDSRLLQVLRGDRRSMEIAVNHAKPNYSRPPTTLPAGVAGADTGYSRGGGGRGFFETLFGIPSQPAAAPPRPQRRVWNRQAAG